MHKILSTASSAATDGATDAPQARWPSGSREEGANLGIYAETLSPPVTARVCGEFEGATSSKATIAQKEVSEDGEILDFPRDSRTARAERYMLKAAARRLLPKDHRTTKCMHWRLPDHEIQVQRGATNDRAFYNGLQVCAMPWTCPVCASKISERRRQDVSRAIEQAETLGLQVWLLTLTIPHGIGDDVHALLNKMTKAWSRLWNGEQGELLRKAIGLWGHIRALEVTYGVNGFHPHFHVLMFFHPQQMRGQGWGALGPRWQKVCVRSGLPMPDLMHGCRIDGGSKAAGYVAKGVWGLESEVTKGHVKTGRNGSRTPFDLLRDYHHGDKRSGALWRVYVDAFAGRRQLYWSNGLRKLLSLAEMELTDEEIANKPEELPALLLATISDDQWRVIYRRHLESVVLDLAETSVDAMRLFLQSLEVENASLKAS